MGMISLAIAAAVAATGADAAIGQWRTETKNAIIAVERCGASLCGTLTTSDGLRADPDLRDTKNKDASLRGRKLLGLRILGGFTRGDGSWTGGTVYNAADGGTYQGTLTPAGADHLKVRGCIVWPLCKTETWTRVR